MRTRAYQAVVLAVVLALATSADTTRVPWDVWLVQGVGAGASSPIPAATSLTSYRVVYDVARFEAPLSVDEIDVDRPYLGRFVERQGSRTLEGWLTNDSGEWFWDQGGWSRLSTGHQPATNDFDLTPALQVAVRTGDAIVLGHETILGRRCTLVRTGNPLGEAMAPPTPGNYDDICVDTTGIALSDRWVSNSKVLQTKTAVVFDPGAALGSPVFQADPVGPNLSPQILPSASSGEVSSAFSSLPYGLHPPAGFSPDGGFLAVPLAQGAASGPAAYVENFRDRNQLIELEEGSSGGVAGSSGIGVNLPLGRGVLDVELAGSTLSITLPDGYDIQLLGSDPSLLLEAGAGLYKRSPV